MKIHLSCGRNVLSNWDNYDLKPRTDKVKIYDAKKVFPIEDLIADIIYHEHFLEHLTKEEGAAFLRECFRILKPEGVMRISTPDLDTFVEAYNDNDIYFWRKRKIYFEPRSKSDILNYGLTNHEHKYTYNYEDLEKILLNIGFQTVVRCEYKIGYLSSELSNLESRRDGKELIVECKKSKEANATVKHPMQPIIMVGKVARFKENKIINYLFDSGLLDLNKIAPMPFPKEDYSQLMQLLGYSVSGYGELSSVDEESVRIADGIVNEMIEDGLREEAAVEVEDENSEPGAEGQSY